MELKQIPESSAMTILYQAMMNFKWILLLINRIFKNEEIIDKYNKFYSQK